MRDAFGKVFPAEADAKMLKIPLVEGSRKKKHPCFFQKVPAEIFNRSLSQPPGKRDGARLGRKPSETVLVPVKKCLESGKIIRNDF